MDLSIIIVAHNVKELVFRCLKAVVDSKDTLEKETIFVDNGSDDGTVEMIERSFPFVTLIRSPTNLGFIPANNLGYDKASGKYILMLNSDAFLEEHTLQKCIDFFENRPECGVLGCFAVDSRGTPLASARIFPTPWRLFLRNLGKKDLTIWADPGELTECDWVTGCCLFVRREIVEQFPFFLRPQLFMYNDDNDLCLRAKRLGWKVYVYPETIVHLAGVNNEQIAKKQKDPERLERLMLESDYIYFRYNDGLYAVILHAFLLCLFHFYRLVKSLFYFQKENVILSGKSLVRVFYLLFKTSFGKRL